MKPREMRIAQKNYFSIRKSGDQIATKQALQYSIRLEAQVDAEISRVCKLLKEKEQQ